MGNAEWKGCLDDFHDVAKSKAVGAKTAEEEEEINVKRGWRWTQTESDVEILVTLPEGTTKAGVSVVFNRTSLKVALKSDPSNPLLDAKKLFHPVAADECTWVMGSDERGPHLQITLEKEQEQMWSDLEGKR